MHDPQKKIWFPAKRYGWGWGFPCCWQGWVVLAVWILLMSLSAWMFLPAHPWIFEGVILGLALLLVGFCWWKGEQPRWRWGKE